MQKLIFIIFMTVSCLLKSYAQSFWQNTYLSGGVALSLQDRRLFDYPGKNGLLEREKDFLDFNYNISIQTTIFSMSKFHSNIGMGYSLFTSTFSRPFSKSLINGGLSLEARFVGIYSIHKIVFPIYSQYILNKEKNIYINFNLIPAIEFNRTITDNNLPGNFPANRKTYTKFEWEFNSLSCNLGFGARASKRLNADMSFRLLHINRVDKITLNEALFMGNIPEQFQKKFEFYNPFQLMFSVNYILGKNTEGDAPKTKKRRQ
jgi:hypothetical protein